MAIIEKNLDLNGDQTIRESFCQHANTHHLCLGFENNILRYASEGIYPAIEQEYRRIPVMLLFSNPHPLSVCNGMFLTESNSRTFWDRFFESEYLHCNRPINGFANWSEVASDHLAQFMCNAEYQSYFRFYFHCLWPYPTNQVAELFRLCGSRRAPFFQTFNEAAKNELKRTIRSYNIASILIFAKPSFEAVATVHNGINNRIEKIKKYFDRNHNPNNIWRGQQPNNLTSLRSNYGYCNNNGTEGNIPIYLLMPTRTKNHRRNNGSYYFTLMLDAALKDTLNHNAHLLP